MAYKDTLATMKQDAQSQLDKVSDVQKDLQSKVAEIDTLSTDIDAEIKTQNSAGYEEGLKAAGQAGGSDKIYSDAEMNKFIADAKADAVAPLQKQIDSMVSDKAALDAKMIDLQAKVDAMPDVAKAVSDAESKLKAQFVADYESAEVDNDAMIAKYKTAPAAQA